MSPTAAVGVSKQPTKGVGMNGSLPTATRVNGSLSSLPSGFAMACFPSQDSLDKEAQQLTSPIQKENRVLRPITPTITSSSSQKNSHTPIRDSSVSLACNPQTPSSAQATSQSNQRRGSCRSDSASANTSSDQM